MKTTRRSDPCRHGAGPDAEAVRVLKAVEAAHTEHQLEQSPVRREVQRLTDALLTAQFREQRAAIALGAARHVAEHAWEDHSEVCRHGLQQQYDSAHHELKEGEALVRQAARLHVEAARATQVCHAELHFWLEAAESAGCLRDEF